MLPQLLTSGNSCRPSFVSRFARFIAVALLCLSAVATVRAQSSAARVKLQTITPETFSAVHAYGTDVGPVPASQRISLTLGIASTPERSAALTQFLKELSTPGSKNYRKWITPQQLAAAYGATADQIAAANAWAQVQGLTVDAISPSGTRVSVSGFPAQIESAFDVKLHVFQILGHSYFANVEQPSLASEVSALFSSIEGLDNLPTDLTTWGEGPPSEPSTLVNGRASSLTIPVLAEVIDTNVGGILNIDSVFGTTNTSPSQIAGYTSLFRQAAAQGITTILTRVAVSQGFPSGLPEVTVLAHAGDDPDWSTPFAARPDWQSAPGLPADGLRHAPDLMASSAASLTSTLTAIATSIPGNRLGNINPVLYQLAPTPGLFDQNGSWAAASGLGMVDLDKLGKVFPRGTGSSYVSLAANNYAPLYGDPLTFTSQVTSGTGGPIPTGTVTYITTAGATICGPVNEDANGNTTCTTTVLSPGGYQIVASYSGDATYAPATSAPPAGVTVQAPNSALSGTVSSGNIIGGTFTTTVTATVAAGGPQPTGNITLNISGTNTSWTQPLVPVTATSSAAVFTEPATTVGTLTLNATCSGTTNFNCPNPLTENVTIAKANPGLTISYTPNPPVSGGTISLSAKLTAYGTAPIPTGTVTFFDNGVGLKSATIQADGSASTTGVVPQAATHTITATYNGSPDYNPITTSGTTTGGLTATSALLTTSSNSVAPNQGFTVSVVITPATLINNTQPTGNVTISDNGTPILFPALVNGRADLPTSLTTPGGHVLTASYPGDATYGPSVSPSITITVNGATGGNVSATIITSSSYAVTYGQTFTLTAGVSSKTNGGATPTGSVTFSIASGAAIGTVPLTAGLASYLVATPPPPGNYTYTATYSGDATYAASTSPASTPIVVSPAVATLTATVNPTTVGTGASATLSATVTLPGSSLPPTGTITVTVPGVNGAVYSGTLTATGTNAGSVNIAIPAPPSGTYQLQVACTGSTNYSCPATTVTLVSTATTAGGLATAGIVLSSRGSGGIAGGNVTLTALVNGPVGSVTAPTGTVSFYVEGTTPVFLGKATLSTIGQALATATINTVSIPAGTQNVYAVYSGDTIYATVTSAPISVGLSDYSVTFTPPSITLSPGNTATVFLQTNAFGGFSGTIALACSPPPDSAITCSLSPTNVAAGGTSTLTIVTVAPRLQAQGDTPGLKTLGGVTLAALLCFLLPGRNRRRLPGLLLVLLAIGLTTNLGCSSSSASGLSGGTPLGTLTLKVFTAGSNGTTAVSHDYQLQITVK